MPRLPKHIAVTAGMVAAVGAFGVGAYALSQDVSSFDPSAFISSYDRGAQDRQKGYQANRTESDAKANRSDDDDDKGAGTDTQETTEAPATSRADIPAASASGTTAVRVTGDGSGTGVNVADGGSAGSGGTVVSGPVIPGGGENTSGGTGNGGQGGGSSNGGTSSGETSATENSYRLLPDDPVPDSKQLDSVIGQKPVGEGDDTIENLTVDDVTVSIMAANAWGSSENDLYVGQKLDAWKVFCALNASYVFGAYPDSHSYAWSCAKGEFDSYDFFKVTEFPETVPSEDFEIKGLYRINGNDTWHEWSVTYTPAQSCTFIVSTKFDADGNREVLGKKYPDSFGSNTIRMNDYISPLLSSLGYIDDDGNLTHLLIGWQEGDTTIGLNDAYTPEPGRHVISPGKIVKLASGCTASMTYEFTESGELWSLQTLTGIDEDSSILGTTKGGYSIVRVPKGIQKVALDQDTCLEVDYLHLSDSVLSVDATGACLRVDRAYKVSDDNPLYATTEDGILCNKDATEYYGVPANMRELTIPSGVTSVALPEGNKLRAIVLEGIDSDTIPAIDLDKVTDCTIVLDAETVGEFISMYANDLDSASGNTIALSSNSEVKLSLDRGVLTSGSRVVAVADVGSSWAEIAKMGKKAVAIGSGAFKDNQTVDTVVLSGAGSYELEDGCFKGGAVDTVVCATERQAEYVRGRLEAAGAPDATVTVLEHNGDGFYYYAVDETDIDEETGEETACRTTTLWKAPASLNSFYGTFVASDGTEMAPDLIASWAFKGCDHLEWAMTADETFYIGSEAFKGCSALQGFFISCPDEFTAEQGAFSSCSSMRYLAARASQGNIGDDNEPNAACLMYAPTGAGGYTPRFTAFTVESNVQDYSVIEQDDGSLLLCGCADSYGGAWLVLASGNKLSGEVRLPGETMEIFSSAFESVEGSFTINWDDLGSLQWIDSRAFYGSGVAGDLHPGLDGVYMVTLGDSAFSYCSGIETVTCDAGYINMGSGVFSACTALTKFTTSSTKDWSGGSYISSGAFYGCTALTDLVFTGYSPTNISLFDYGAPFVFDGSISADDDAERIHITVPEGTEQDYLDAWVYLFSGYKNYDALYQAIYNEMLYRGSGIGAQASVPSEEKVKQELIARLTKVENRLRKMLGMPSVESTTLFSTVTKDGCTFDTRDGQTYLTGVDRNATEIDLSSAVPDDIEGVIIPSGVFSKCKNLKRIVLGDKVSQIQSGAFTACDGVEVVLPEVAADSWEPSVMLVAASDGVLDTVTPFSFGADIKLTCDEASAQMYLAVWPQQMVGCDSWTMGAYVGQIYWTLTDAHPDGDFTADDLNYAVNAPFLEQENIMRAMMGLDEVEDYRDATSFYDASWYMDPWGDLDWDRGDVEGDEESPDTFDGEAGSKDAVGDEAQGDKDGQHDDGVDAGAASGEL